MPLSSPWRTRSPPPQTRRQPGAPPLLRRPHKLDPQATRKALLDKSNALVVRRRERSATLASTSSTSSTSASSPARNVHRTDSSDSIPSVASDASSVINRRLLFESLGADPPLDAAQNNQISSTAPSRRPSAPTRQPHSVSSSHSSAASSFESVPNAAAFNHNPPSRPSKPSDLRAPLAPAKASVSFTATPTTRSVPAAPSKPNNLRARSVSSASSSSTNGSNISTSTSIAARVSALNAAVAPSAGGTSASPIPPSSIRSTPPIQQTQDPPESIVKPSDLRNKYASPFGPVTQHTMRRPSAEQQTSSASGSFGYASLPKFAPVAHEVSRNPIIPNPSVLSESKGNGQYAASGQTTVSGSHTSAATDSTNSTNVAAIASMFGPQLDPPAPNPSRTRATTSGSASFTQTSSRPTLPARSSVMTTSAVVSSNIPDVRNTHNSIDKPHSLMQQQQQPTPPSLPRRPISIIDTVSNQPIASASTPKPIPHDAYTRYADLFHQLDTTHRNILDGTHIKSIWIRSNLSRFQLATIWQLVDIHRIGALRCNAFTIGMFLIDDQLKGNPLPSALPPNVVSFCQSL